MHTIYQHVWLVNYIIVLEILSSVISLSPCAPLSSLSLCSSVISLSPCAQATLATSNHHLYNKPHQF